MRIKKFLSSKDDEKRLSLCFTNKIDNTNLLNLAISRNQRERKKRINNFE